MKVAVVVPAYGVERYLGRCVDSILAQTYRDFELILVDDGSPDACGTICDGYAERDGRVSVIHQSNGGLSAARNRGIEKVLADGRCDWITFVDGDDWVSEDYLSALVRGVGSGADMSAVGYAVTSGETVAGDSAACGFRNLSPREFWTTSLTNPYTAWAKLYRVSAFVDLRYPVGRLHEDQYLAHRLVFGAKSVACSGARLYMYFRRADGICGSVPIGRLDRLQAWKDEISFFESRDMHDLAEDSRRNLIDDCAGGLRMFRKGVWRRCEHPAEFAMCREILRRTIREVRLPLRGHTREYGYAWPWVWPFVWLIEVFVRGGLSCTG